MSLDSKNVLEIICNAKLFSVLLLIIYELLNPNINRSLTNASCIISLFTQTMTHEIRIVAKKCQFYGESVLLKLASLERDTNLDSTKKNILDENYLKLIMLSLNLAVLNGELEAAKTLEVKLGSLEFHKFVKSDFIFECSRFLYNFGLSQFQDNQYEMALFLTLTCIKYLECDGICFKNSRAFKERYFNSYVLLGKHYRL